MRQNVPLYSRCSHEIENLKRFDLKKLNLIKFLIIIRETPIRNYTCISISCDTIVWYHSMQRIPFSRALKQTLNFHIKYDSGFYYFVFFRLIISELVTHRKWHPLTQINFTWCILKFGFENISKLKFWNNMKKV